MTFIATVIARDGVAVIADSLVTAMHRTVEERDFLRFLKNKSKKSKKKEIIITAREMSKLFKLRPSHTRDYESKLFEYDEFTAITTSGVARICDKRIEEVLFKMIEKNKKDKGYSRKKIETKAKELCEFLQGEVEKHIKKYDYFSGVKFLLTHFNKGKNKTSVYKINMFASTKKDLGNRKKIVEFVKAAKYERVVCEGQNRISEKVLFGDLITVWGLIPKMVEKIIKDFKIDSKKIPKDYVNSLRKDDAIMTQSMWRDVKMFRLTELSLQQAVDLANLLMNIEIDFQKYTESIPTVGGVVKLKVDPIVKTKFRQS